MPYSIAKLCSLKILNLIITKSDSCDFMLSLSGQASHLHELFICLVVPTGRLNVSDENISDIIRSACYLQMEHAIQLSFDYVKTTIRCDVPSHWNIVCHAASHAAAHGLSESFELCLDKIAYWFSAIYNTEMFKKLLTYEILHKLLDRPELTKWRDFAKEMTHHKVKHFWCQF